jgi:CRISPR-associated protein Cas1
MATLYVTEQGAMLRKVSGRLVVAKKGEVLAEIPAASLETIFLYGSVQISFQALAEMLDQGIELALFSVKGRLRGQITPPRAKNVPLRMKQYELAFTAPDRCLALSQEITAAKIANASAVLRRFRRNHPDAVSRESLAELEACQNRVATTSGLDELRGVEGIAAARYFGTFAELVPPSLGFTGRNRRPPRDPMNALLSFGYVLVGNELQSLLDGMGFDPYAGFFHQIEYGRPSLALDLLEELRAPLIDRFSLGLLLRRTLTAADFASSLEKGVLLEKKALGAYFKAYEEELTRPFELDGETLTFRLLFRRQAERLVRCLIEDEPYKSLRWPAD